MCIYAGTRGGKLRTCCSFQWVWLLINPSLLRPTPTVIHAKLHMRDQRSAPEHVSPSLHPSSLPLSASSLQKTKKKKERSSHSDREQRKTWPGLSPLRRPDWTSPAERALLPCGWRGRQILRALLWTQSHLSSPVKADLHRSLRAAVMTHLWLNERKPQRLLFDSATLANDERVNERRLTGNDSQSPRCGTKSPA